MSTSSIAILSILCILFVILDVILLIRSAFKLKTFVKEHKNSAKYKRTTGTTSGMLHTRTERLSAKARHDAIFPNYEEKSLTMLSQVRYDVTTDEVTMFSSKQTRKEENAGNDASHTRINESNIDAMQDDVTRVPNSCSVVMDLKYELVSFSNVFLLVRLKKNLKFLSAILLLYCFGFGAAVVFSLILSFTTVNMQMDGNAIALFLPAAISQAIIALVLCCTTSDLKLAMLSPIRRLFYICRGCC